MPNENENPVIVRPERVDDASAQDVECDEEVDTSIENIFASLDRPLERRQRRSTDQIFEPLFPPVPPIVLSNEEAAQRRLQRARDREQRLQDARHARLNRTEDTAWKQAARNVPEGGMPENLPVEEVADVDFDVMQAVKDVFADVLDWEVRNPQKTCQQTWQAPKAVTFWKAFEAMRMLRDQPRFRPYYLRRMGRDLAPTGVMVTLARENGAPRMFLHFPESQGQGCDGYNSMVDWAYNYVGPSEARWLENDGIENTRLSEDAENGCDCEDCCHERRERRRRRDIGTYPDVSDIVSGYPAKRTLRLTW